MDIITKARAEITQIERNLVDHYHEHMIALAEVVQTKIDERFHIEIIAIEAGTMPDLTRIDETLLLIEVIQTEPVTLEIVEIWNFETTSYIAAFDMLRELVEVLADRSAP
ncbi:MAG: hypothetical protein LPK02_07070 [Rhodobacterales bacterium]|nr:hypothetical protein [Rhodobacterales bacterium]